ncbi:replication protein A 70 kDa DNA-binding subunit B-like [Senna tora]|uniref:Replication protein A 70 kDa DNA-binding subunit B-like n=1 Tax=Senna tora TaxID=362788 RepID=A0A834W195_9FABA|nr:replication protein A 70 kDa DNA-binding subunit B-like [Senna tora]
MWFMPPFSNLNKATTRAASIQMVLCDKEKTTIGASVLSMYLNKFKGSLAEGGVYVLSRFGVSHSGGNFRITPHSFKINFLFGTRVMPTVDDNTIHRFGFQWVTTNSITSGGADERTMVGIKSRLSATLWGHYCNQLQQFMDKYTEGPVIIAMQYCKIKEFNAHHSLSNSIHATCIMINERFEEFMGFDDNGVGTDLKSPMVGSSSSSVKSSTNYEDPFSNTSITSINDLLLSEDKSVHCIIGTIQNCESFVTTPIARFKITLVVIDDTAPVNITLFDHFAAKFLGVSADYLKTRSNQV